MFNEVKTLISYDLMKKMHDGLYDYQRECCDTAIKKLKEPGESFKGQIILPTGSGKTKIAEYLTAEVLKSVFWYGTSICKFCCCMSSFDSCRQSSESYS